MAAPSKGPAKSFFGASGEVKTDQRLQAEGYPSPDNNQTNYHFLSAIMPPHPSQSARILKKWSRRNFFLPNPSPKWHNSNFKTHSLLSQAQAPWVTKGFQSLDRYFNCWQLECDFCN
jgi:hypothetical protein